MTSAGIDIGARTIDIVLFKDGKIIANRVGATTKENLKEWINSSMKG